MVKLHEIYNPRTAAPFACNETYMEFQPGEELKPYIKCFWGTKKPYKQIKTDIPTQSIVIPDTCTDIIFAVDFINKKINGKFSRIDNRSFAAHNKNNEEKTGSTFAIRFYPWSAILFYEETMKDTKNRF